MNDNDTMLTTFTWIFAIVAVFVIGSKLLHYEVMKEIEAYAPKIVMQVKQSLKVDKEDENELWKLPNWPETQLALVII